MFASAHAAFKIQNSTFIIISATILGLAAIEGTAYWWMHPAPAGLGEPVLVWKRGDREQETGDRGQGSEVGSQRSEVRGQRSEVGGQRSEVGGQRPEVGGQRPEVGGQRLEVGGQRSEVGKQELGNREQENAPAQRSSPTDNRQPTTNNSSSSPSSIQNHYSITFLPDLVAKSIPILHCSSGTAVRFDGEDGVTIHAALFEWNGTDSPNVLEAYKHPPEACMGYIGLQLLDHLPTRTYQVGAEALRFEHTMFREPGGAIVHAFKGVWISGGNKIITDSARALSDQSRQIRWKAALKRFRPAHATAVQGAVRDTLNPEHAWQAFQYAMLKDLKFKNPPH